MDLSVLDFGVPQGQEVAVGDIGWPLLTLPPDTVLEVGIGTCSVGLGFEGWFAVLVRATYNHPQGER